MPLRSSAEFRANWSALRPGRERPPAQPPTADERLVLRLLPVSGEKPLSTARLAIGLNLETAKIEALEKALASLRARGIAENIGVDAWRRSM